MRYLLSIAAVAAVSTLAAEIQEIKSVLDVRAEVTPQSLVFFNITGVLYAPGSTLADRRWRDFFAARVKELISDPQKAEALINRVKNEIVQKVPKRLVENAMPGLVSSLQRENIPVFAITQKETSTAYASNFGEVTSNHLKRLGFNFEETLSSTKIAEPKGDSYTLFQGILFTQNKPAGPALQDFLNRNKLTDRKIIVVDNNLEPLESIQKVVGDAFRGYHLTIPREPFNPEIGIIEFLTFVQQRVLLGDNEAEQIKEFSPTTDFNAQLDQYILKS